MTFCKHCGCQIEDGSTFCGVCGKPQNVNPAPQAPQYAAPQYQAPQYTAPQYQAPQYAAPQYAAPQYTPVQVVPQDDTVPGKGLGVPSMILGILALFFVLLWFSGESAFVVCSLVMSIASIVLGAIAKSKANAAGKSNGMANAGVICSIVTLAIFTFFLVIGLAVYGSIIGALT